jgi:zinc protease
MRRATFALFWVALVGSATQAADAKTVPWEKAGIDWEKTPPLGADTAYTPPKSRRVTLKNGLAVLIVQRGGIPIVSMQLVVAGAGSGSDPAKKSGLAALAADLLDEGAGGLSALQISDEVERLGASLGVWADVDAAYVHASTLSRTIQPTLELLTKVVTAPSFDAKEWARIHDDVKTDLVLRRDQAPSVAALVFATVVGGDGPYGHPPAGFLDEVETIGLDEVKAFYARTWQPSRMTLIVSGDVDPDKLVELLQAGLGAWSPPAPAAQAAPKGKPKAPPFARLALVDKPGAEQTQLAIGRPGIARTDRRYHAVEVLTTSLGGSFTSRLTQRLREQLGYTYGIGAAMRALKDGGVFQIRSGVFTGFTIESLVEIRKILGDLARKDMPAAELNKTKQLLIRALPQSLDSNDEIVEQLAELALYGLPDDWFDGYAAAIEKVTARDVRRLAAQLIPEGRMTYVLVGDLSKIEPLLAKLKLGKARRYDADGRPVRR